MCAEHSQPGCDQVLNNAAIVKTKDKAGCSALGFKIIDDYCDYKWKKTNFDLLPVIVVSEPSSVLKV